MTMTTRLEAYCSLARLDSAILVSYLSRLLNFFICHALFGYNLSQRCRNPMSYTRWFNGDRIINRAWDVNR